MRFNEQSENDWFQNTRFLKIKSFHKWSNKSHYQLIQNSCIGCSVWLICQNCQDEMQFYLSWYIDLYSNFLMVDNNLPVMANSKVNNHCSILISIDLYILGVTKRRKYEIKTIHRAYDYLFGFRNESTTPSGCSIPSVLNNKFSHSL